MKRIVEAINDMATIWADEVKMAFKDVGVFLFVVIVPIAYPILYSWIYNNEVVHEVPVAVLDRSHSAESREFLRRLDASPYVKVAKMCHSVDEARNSVGKQETRGVIYFPTNFAQKLNRDEQAHVGVYCDMASMLYFKAIYQTSMAVSMDMNSNIQIEKSAQAITEKDEEMTIHPLHVEEVQIFNNTGGYGNAILPGVLMLLIQQTLLLGIGLAAGTQREQNRYGNLVPISKHYNGVFRIVAGKALAYLMLYAVIGAYLALIIPTIFHFTIMASVKALIGLLLPYTLACIFFGMTLSCLIRYRENVMLIVVFMSLILLFMTGISWPYTSIPAAWKSIAWLFPSTFGIRGFLKISSMGGTLDAMSLEYRVLWVQVIVYFLTSCLVYGIQLRRARKL